MGRFRRLLHSWFRPLVDAFWRFSERVISRQLRLRTHELRPDVPLRKSTPCITLALDDLKSIHEGRVALFRGAVARYTTQGLELEDGKRIEAQVVVLATGFRQDLPFLAAAERAALFDPAG